MATQPSKFRYALLITIALVSLRIPLSELSQKIPTLAPQNTQIAQFEPPIPPDPGSPSGHGQGGGTREYEPQSLKIV